MSSQLDSIKKYSKIVADTGDFNLIARYEPEDSTTNPSLIRQACLLPQYKHLIDSAIHIEKEKNGQNIDVLVDKIVTRLIVLFGVEILKIVPGKVSSEIDASLSFDTEGTINKALHLIGLYKEYGISSDRIYLKISSTWEGIQAAKILKSKHSGIHINMTLLFSLVQAVACANVGVDLISPFVGRISDWYKNAKGLKIEHVEDDPGVLSVQKIFSYYKKFGVQTIVMGASFRNIDQIKALTGIDALTISPKLLEELKSLPGVVAPFKLIQENIDKMHVDEKEFRWLMNCDEMASTKLEEGIRLFHKDTELLKEDIRKLLN